MNATMFDVEEYLHLALHAGSVGDATVAREKLALGLSRESRNPALSALMRRLLDWLSKGDDAAVSETDAQNNQVSLGACRHTSS